MKPAAVLSKHAKVQIALRNIDESVILKTVAENQPFSVEGNLAVYHTIISENNKPYLIRIFVNRETNPNLIITVYKTSKLNKYQ